MVKRLSLVAVLALSAAVAVAADAPAKKKRPSTRPSAAAVTPYPLKTCIVSNEEFGGDMGDPIVIQYEGREVKFCCKSCTKKFNKDPEKYLKKLDEAAKKQDDKKAAK